MPKLYSSDYRVLIHAIAQRIIDDRHFDPRDIRAEVDRLSDLTNAYADAYAEERKPKAA